MHVVKCRLRNECAVGIGCCGTECADKLSVCVMLELVVVAVVGQNVLPR